MTWVRHLVHVPSERVIDVPPKDSVFDAADAFHASAVTLAEPHRGFDFEVADLFSPPTCGADRPAQDSPGS